MKNLSVIGLILIIFVTLGMAFSPKKKNAQDSQKESAQLANTPPMGWNSFDSYGVYLHEKAALENLEAFAKKLAPYGYEYFVIDA